MTKFDIERSWATEPLFYEAPSPPSVTPRQYQLAGVEYHISRDHAIFGDAPGLGKSGECILLDNAIRATRTLIVCPASLRLNWEREVWKWSLRPNVSTYPVLRASDGISSEADFVIISYDLLRNVNILRAILALTWDHLILDEAHYLKDPKGNKRTQAICAPDALPSVVGRITMASGTLTPNQPIECYNAIRLLDWGAINRASLETFKQTYYEEGEGFVTRRYIVCLTCNREDCDNPFHDRVSKYGQRWSKHVRNVPCNLDDLRQRLRGKLMVRRLKEHVLPELPKRQWHMFPLASTPGIRKAFKSEAWKKVEKLYEMDPEIFDSGVPIDGAVATARRELGEEKAPGVCDFIEELLAEGARKVIVGAWHHSVLDLVRERLDKYGLVYMDGRTSPRAKQDAVDRFQEDDSIRVIEGQIKTMGEGWPLTAAQDVVLVEPDWTPGRNDQFLDRPHRIGQEGDYVLGHVPFVPNTIDERILGRVIEKDQAIYETMDRRD